MNPMTPKRTRRLRARAATMQAAEEYDDYGPEPNMKLSHAFLVVLMLHVIAVGGLYAFNSMKAGKSTSQASSKPHAAATAASHKAEKNDEAPKGGGPSQKPPAEEKAPLVAKVAEAPKSTKTTGADSAKSGTAKPDPAQKGLFASAKGALQKAAGIGVTAAGASKAAAQAPATEVTNGAVQAGSETTSDAGSKTYTVRAGDTMTRISSSLGVAIPDLEKVNSLASNAVLQVGQVLKVPEKAVAQAAASVAAGAGKVVESAAKLPGAVASAVSPSQSAESNAATASVPAQTGPTTEYTVVKGDNPWKIAKKFKISQDELMKANGITDPKKIQIGQQLKIPAPAAKGSK